MTGPKKDKINLSEQGVVTEEALIAYINNKLSPDEKQQLEKLLQEDPFAQDALEGLQSSTNRASVTTSISSLNKKVRERSGLKERKKLQIHWANYAWAAVLVGLLIAIGFVMINFFNKAGDHNLALNEKKETPTAPVFEKKDTVVEAEKNAVPLADSASAGKSAALTDTVVRVATGSTVSGTLNTQTKPATTETKTTTAPQQTTTSSVTIAQDKKASPANNVTKPAEKANDQGAFKQKAHADSVSVAVNGYAVYQNVGVTSAQVLKKELKPDASVSQDDAMKSFNSGDYNAAADAFEKILKREPDNADALYFGGISDYINGKTAKSEINFDKLLKKGNIYTDGSKWYKANILLKKGKTDAAKTLLQDLTNTNGSYKERAIKKLAELGF